MRPSVRDTNMHVFCKKHFADDATEMLKRTYMLVLQAKCFLLREAMLHCMCSRIALFVQFWQA